MKTDADFENDGHAAQESRQDELLIVVQDAVDLQLRQYLASASCHVAQCEGGVDVLDVERKAVLLVEGDAHQQLHLHSALQRLPRLVLKTKTQEIIGTSPAVHSGSRYNRLRLIIFLYELSIEMPAVACRGIGEFALNPVLVVQRRREHRADDMVQLIERHRIIPGS